MQWHGRNASKVRRSDAEAKASAKGIGQGAQIGANEPTALKGEPNEARARVRGIAPQHTVKIDGHKLGRVARTEQGNAEDATAHHWRGEAKSSGD